MGDLKALLGFPTATVEEKDYAIIGQFPLLRLWETAFIATTVCHAPQGSTWDW